MVYYGSDNDPALAAYDVLVLDSDSHPAIDNLVKSGKTVLGYISLGEVEKNRSYYSLVRDQGLLLARNKNWPDSNYVDVRDARWTDLVVNTVIPGILAQGFTGLFLDTLDDPADLERREPKRFKGMTAAAVALVQRIHQAHPGMPIMVNRAYEILPDVASSITMSLQEGLVSDYDFDTKKYRMVKPRDTAQQRTIIQAAETHNPSLGLYSLDYWDPADKATIARIYKRETSDGFIPYVSTVDLGQIVPRP